MEANLSVSNLSFERDEQVLFNHLNFDIGKSTLFVIQGKNGSGKSTLLRLLTNLIPPTMGEIRWQGKLITALKKNYLQHLHYVGHQNGIQLNLTAFENLMLKTYLTKSSHESVMILLQALKLPSEILAKQFSAGQKRKLALAQLCLIKKPLWILDEPFTALDYEAEKYFKEHMSLHLQQGGIIILTTHQTLAIDAPFYQTLTL